MADDAVDLLAIVARERRDDEPALAPFTCRGDEAFLLEPMERAANGGATEAEALAYHALGDAGAGGQLSPDDDAAEVVVRARDVVLTLVGARGRWGGAAAGGFAGGA